VINDVRKGEADPDAPLFTDNAGNALTGNAVRKLFDRRKVVTGIDDLCGHAPPHLGDELPPLGERQPLRSTGRRRMAHRGGWSGDTRSRGPSKSVDADRRRSPHSAKRPEGKRPSQQRSGLYGKRIA